MLIRSTLFFKLFIVHLGLLLKFRNSYHCRITRRIINFIYNSNRYHRQYFPFNFCFTLTYIRCLKGTHHDLTFQSKTSIIEHVITNRKAIFRNGGQFESREREQFQREKKKRYQFVYDKFEYKYRFAIAFPVSRMEIEAKYLRLVTWIFRSYLH